MAYTVFVGDIAGDTPKEKVQNSLAVFGEVHNFKQR